jgi:hypothetical protein
MDVTTLLIAGILDAIVGIARRPIRIAIVTIAFVAIAAISLVLSGIVFNGWWQGFFQALGVGILLAGIVDVAILGALRGLLEGERQPQEMTDYLRAEIWKIARPFSVLHQAALDLVREDETTVALIMQGSVQEVASKIVMRLDKPDEADIETARLIATCLASSAMEIALHRADPEPFRRMLFSRLQRISTTEAYFIDRGLLELRAELVSRFSAVAEQFDRVLERLPPPPTTAPESGAGAFLPG